MVLQLGILDEFYTLSGGAHYLLTYTGLASDSISIETRVSIRFSQGTEAVKVY